MVKAVVWDIAFSLKQKEVRNQVSSTQAETLVGNAYYFIFHTFENGVHIYNNKKLKCYETIHSKICV